MFPSAMALNQPPPIRDHVPPILIGVGAIFASFACPSIPASVQGLLRRQGQRPRVPSLAEVGKQASSIQDNESVQGDSTVATPRESVSAKRESTNGAPADSTASTMNKDFAMMALDNIRSSFVKSTNGSSASLEELATGLAFSKRKKTTTSPFLSKRNSGLSPDAGTEFASTVSHYFYSETQFLLTLVEISDRLVSVPKPARQSTLVAELTLFNHNLPADVCLPLWCPYTSEHPYHHQVVRVSPSDAVVLNSAERVPYLILVEVVEQRGPKDAKELSRKVSSTCSPQMSNIDPGDLSTSKIELMENVQRINQFLRRGSDNSLPPSSPLSGRASVPSVQVAEAVTPQRALKSPNVASPPPMSPSTSSQPPPSDINIRMRTAAVMLAQLYQHQNAQNQGKKVNTQAQTLFNDIRAKLIQEMMDLETVRVAGLESNAGEDLSERNSVSNAGSPDHYAAEDVVPAKPPNKDTDDPSAAVFREPWSVKKERIRQASPYGHNVNWNLLSVIVKSGADLRQEQIALQLIYEMDRVWKEDAIPVWIYK